MATKVRDIQATQLPVTGDGEGEGEGVEQGFERVVEFTNPTAGLTAFVAIHSTALGPALGGARMFDYPSRRAAIADVCNLARGMSYKNALAGIGFGGGKAVIVGAPEAKTPELLAAFGEGLNALGGAYLSAEDSGVSPADMAVIGKVSDYVAGADADVGGGNPGPFTARGVFLGLQAAVAFRLGMRKPNDLAGLTVGIEGLGQVGFALAAQLRQAGARVLASELNGRRLRQAQTELGVEPLAGGDLASRELDVFAPCALGGALTCERLAELRAPVIAGAANNQLASPVVGELLASRGQLYAPDYVINAAGVISIAGEYLGVWSPDWVDAKVDQIPARLRSIFERAVEQQLPTSLVADNLAREAIRSAGNALLSKSA